MNVAAVVFTLKNKLLVVQELYFKPNLLISKLTALKKKLKRNLNIKNIEKKVNFFDQGYTTPVVLRRSKKLFRY